jgi:hypothetical protein
VSRSPCAVAAPLSTTGSQSTGGHRVSVVSGARPIHIGLGEAGIDVTLLAAAVEATARVVSIRWACVVLGPAPAVRAGGRPAG